MSSFRISLFVVLYLFVPFSSLFILSLFIVLVKFVTVINSCGLYLLRLTVPSESLTSQECLPSSPLSKSDSLTTLGAPKTGKKCKNPDTQEQLSKNAKLSYCQFRVWALTRKSNSYRGKVGCQDTKCGLLYLPPKLNETRSLRKS